MAHWIMYSLIYYGLSEKKNKEKKKQDRMCVIKDMPWVKKQVSDLLTHQCSCQKQLSNLSPIIPYLKQEKEGYIGTAGISFDHRSSPAELTQGSKTSPSAKYLVLLHRIGKITYFVFIFISTMDKCIFAIVIIFIEWGGRWELFYWKQFNIRSCKDSVGVRSDLLPVNYCINRNCTHTHARYMLTTNVLKYIHKHIQTYIYIH